MEKDKRKPFFFRIDLIDLMDFATEPEGMSMSLLEFSKELKRGHSQHAAIQTIIDEANNYIEKKKIAGGKGGKAKASSAKASPSSAIADASTGLANPSIPLARSSNRSSNNNTTKDLVPFEDFYSIFPKKKDKEKARKAWDNLRVESLLFGKIKTGLENQKNSADWKKENGKYIPLPTTWLNGRRWEDETELTIGDTENDRAAKEARIFQLYQESQGNSGCIRN